MPFLLRIRVVNNNSDVSGITVVRKSEKEGGDSWLKPFGNPGDIARPFPLKNQDRIIVPSTFVYVRGACRNPGAYPFIMNLTAKDYAGMLRDYQSGGMKGVRIYHTLTGKTSKDQSPSWRGRRGSAAIGGAMPRDYGPIPARHHDDGRVLHRRFRKKVTSQQRDGL
jgi:hypothetical protein